MRWRKLPEGMTTFGLGDGQGGLYLENTMGIPNNHLDFDGPEAVAVVVAEIAKKLGDNEDN